MGAARELIEREIEETKRSDQNSENEIANLQKRINDLSGQIAASGARRAELEAALDALRPIG